MQKTLLFFLVCVVALTTGCSQVFRGASGCDDAAGCSAAKTMGAEHLRVYLHWRYVQRTLAVSELNLSNVDQVKANLSLIDAWANSKQVNWAEHDRRVKMALDAGLIPLGEVGEGTPPALPTLSSSEENGAANVADPKALGKDVYLAYMYLTTRAIVRRYKATISIWQIENELNEAYLASVGQQRSFHVVGNPWADFDFLTALIKTLHMAVKEEQPGSVVTQNLHSDISADQHHSLHLPGYFIDAAKAWNEYVDIWSIDGYPNYFGAYPLFFDELGSRVANLSAAVGKDVFVMETGYPILHNSSGAADILNYSDERQASYAAGVWHSIDAAGGCGLFYFTIRATDGLATPPNGWTSADADFVSDLSSMMHGHGGGGMFSIATLLLRHPSETKRIGGLVDYSSAWGSMYKNGTARPMMAALAQAWRK